MNEHASRFVNTVKRYIYIQEKQANHIKNSPGKKWSKNKAVTLGEKKYESNKKGYNNSQRHIRTSMYECMRVFLPKNI